MPTVPFISQLEVNDTRGWCNCGPASLHMLLAYNKLVGTDAETLHQIADFVRDGVYNDDHWRNSFTDYPRMVQLIEGTHHKPARILEDWGSVRASLNRGQPVILFVQNDHLQPRQYPPIDGFNAPHFIVLTGFDADTDTFQ